MVKINDEINSVNRHNNIYHIPFAILCDYVLYDTTKIDVDDKILIRPTLIGIFVHKNSKRCCASPSSPFESCAMIREFLKTRKYLFIWTL